MSESAPPQHTLLPNEAILGGDFTRLFLTQPDFNILDMSAIGSGKTTKALHHIEWLVNHGHVVLMILPSYQLLEEKFGEISCQDQAIIFRGRPQKGMCPRYTIEQETFLPYSKPCRGCLQQCNYMEQKKRIKDIKYGFAIFTVRQNLPTVLELLKQRVTIFIDDVSLDSVINPKYTFDLDAISNYVSRFNDIPNIQDFIRSLRVDTGEMIQVSYELIRDGICSEEEKFAEHIRADLSDGKEIPDLNGFFSLLWALRKEKGVRNMGRGFEEQNLDTYKKHRIIYISSTPGALETRETSPPNIVNKSLMEMLGQYVTISNPAEPNDNWLFLVVNRRHGREVKFTQQTLCESEILSHTIQEIFPLFECATKLGGEKTLAVTSGNVVKGQYDLSKILSNSRHICKPIEYFSDDSVSTNQHTHMRYAILIGTPNYPSNYFEGMRFDPVRIENSDEPYPVGREITEIESKNQVEQVSARIFRGDQTVQKMVIFFGNLPFGERLNCGAKIEVGYGIHTPSEKGRLISRIKRKLRENLKSLLISKLCDTIDKELTTNEGKVKLDSFATKFITDNSLVLLYSRTTIKGYIEEYYLINLIPSGPKNRLTKYITRIR